MAVAPASVLYREVKRRPRNPRGGNRGRIVGEIVPAQTRDDLQDQARLVAQARTDWIGAGQQQDPEQPPTDPPREHHSLGRTDTRPYTRGSRALPDSTCSNRLSPEMRNVVLAATSDAMQK